MVYSNLYSHRKRAEKNEIELLSYESIPVETRNKIFFAIQRCMPKEEGYGLLTLAIHYAQHTGKFPGEAIKEHLLGNSVKMMFAFGVGYGFDAKKDFHDFFLKCVIDDLFDIIEVFIRWKNWLTQEDKSKIEEFVAETNDILRQDNIGYEIVEKKGENVIIRVDSKYLHKETTKKALNLLHEENFDAALEEFSKALERYTKKEYSEAITYANSAFESTMKIILNKNSGDATQLINELKKHKVNGVSFLPQYYENFSIEIKKILQPLPITRNEKGIPHGKGRKKIVVDKSFAEFALHLSGTFIVFLIKRFKEFEG